MFSARFDGGDIEKKFREVHKLLTEHNFANRMVSASGSDDFGTTKVGVMIAVCTPHYGEMTKSPYSSNAELRFALDERIKVLPLKVADVYPPQPPGGRGILLTPTTLQRPCAGWSLRAQSYTWIVSTSPCERSRE